MNLWYLFSTAELFKLKTFLSGGLWCSDIGSIIGFGEDAEGSGPQGLFVSCWHASEGDPTSCAWTIFGGDGDGFAIRTTGDELQSYATTTSSPAIAARFGPVTYVPEGGTIRDPAFEVLDHHRQEREMRLLLELKARDHDASEIKRQMRIAVTAFCHGRNFTGPIKMLTLSERLDSDFAMILPIDAPRFFKEFLIGSKVTPQDRDLAIQSLRSAGVNCTIRQLELEP
jgi:hypothetical protein